MKKDFPIFRMFEDELKWVSVEKTEQQLCIVCLYVAGGEDTLRAFSFRKTPIDISYKTQQEEGRLSEKK